MQEENDVEYERGVLTRKMESGEDIVIQTDRAAVLRNVSIPKAQYHYVVLPKEDIENVTALTRDHLPLLDHMMELANQTIEQQKHLPSNNFLIGFKMKSFMNRLNMHVISNDFYSDTMRHARHWNTFNTDLFITFRAVYALLNIKGSIEPLPPETVEKLLLSMPFHCNQCKYITGYFTKFKEHLHYHWHRAEKERVYKMNLLQIKQSFGNMNMNGNRKNYGARQNIGPRPPIHMAQQQQRQGQPCAPPDNMKVNNTNMPVSNATTQNAKKPNDV